MSVLAIWLTLHEPVRPETGEAVALDRRVRELRNSAKIEEAIPLARRALELRDTTRSSSPQDIERSLGVLAELYEEQGRYAEAEPLYKRLLSNQEKASAADDAKAASALNRLALIYKKQGRYLEAEPLYKRSLAIREKVLGADDPAVGESLNNLAELYRAQRRYAEAEPLYKRDLAIIEKALGPEHPHVATSLNNLALLYTRQGRQAEAEALFKRSLAIRVKSLRPGHHAVGQSLSNLAELYRIQGRLAEAEPLYEQALAIREAALGPDHEQVGITLNSFALHRDLQGRHDEAEKLYKRALAIREKSFGRDHPDVGETLNNLAKLYRKMGRDSEAAQLEERAKQMPPPGTKHLQLHFATNRKEAGAGHANTGLASFGPEQGEALTLGRAVVRIPEKEVELLARRRDEGLGLPDRSGKELTVADRLKVVGVRSMKDSASYAALAAEALSRTHLYKGQTLVFVHGYNVSFEEALQRAGQIAFDLEFDGLLVPFAWPSRRRFTDYHSDAVRADVAVDHLVKLIDTLGELLPPTRLHFIAHSMGNLVLLRALERVAERRNAGSRVAFGELILAHADIDANRCGQLIRNVRPAVGGITLYVNTGDWALWGSEKLSRSTSCGAKAQVYDGAETIDVSSIRGASGRSIRWTRGWNHDAFVRAPLVFGEITRLLITGTRPPEKRTPELVPVRNAAGKTYWRMEQARSQP
jgi:esterase/lipase superfamily enzyme